MLDEIIVVCYNLHRGVFMQKLIFIKYGELTTKKGNRNVFIKRLTNNIKNILGNINYSMKSDRSRIYIEASDIDLIVEKLKNIFGIHSIVIAYKVDNNSDTIINSVYELIKNESFKNFKVDTKRADKRFNIHSMDFNKMVAAKILKNMDVSVDVHNPELYIKIEIRVEGTFIYFNEIKGLGGYPFGIQGKSLLMLSGGIDSPVAGYLALKRGVDIECLYFESPPHTSDQAKNKVITLANIINKYSGNIKVHIVPFTKIQETILRNVKEEYIITIMRRMMYRIAEKFAKKNKMQVIFNGESIGQVASQTLSSMNVINNVCDIPVIRPVACMDKLEIIDIAKKIGTYETSILPYEDCCTVFVPKHPVINPTLDKCILYEKNFNYESLIDDAINNIDTISNLDNNNYAEIL